MAGLDEAMERIVGLQEALMNRFLERDEAIEGSIVALGCRQHVLLVGPPGTAKSEMVAALTAAIKGAKYFEWCLGKDSKTDELFGPLSIKAYQEGRYERVLDGTLPEADIAFVDEVFNANTTVLNNMLKVMNEREYRNGTNIVRCPLITLFGASNLLPQGEDETILAAFTDRFLFKYKLNYIAEDANFQSMMMLVGSPEMPEVTMDDLRLFQQAAQQIPFDQDTLDAVTIVKRTLQQEGFRPSDRRWRQVEDALRVKAVLAGDSKIDAVRDFDILAHILPPTPEERKPVGKILRKTIDPLGERVAEALEIAQEQMTLSLADPEDAAKATEALKKMTAAVNDMRLLIHKSPGASRRKVQNAMERILRMKNEVVNTCLGGPNVAQPPTMTA
ncbi:MAG: AAA family ATPase [Firmicutes bacterium]|nr:AAA family ATPase [Bacillota bacterium]